MTEYPSNSLRHVSNQLSTNKQSRKRVVMLREGRMSVKLAEMEALVLFEL